MRPRGSITSQLLIAFSVFAILIVVAAIVGFVGVSHQNATARQLTGRDYVLQQTAVHMQENFTTSQVALNTFVVPGRPGALQPITSERASFAANLTRLSALAPRRLQHYVMAMGLAGGRLFAIADRLALLPPQSSVAQQEAGRVAPVAHAFYHANGAMQDHLSAEVKRLTRDSQHALSVALTRSGIALGVAVLLLLGASLSTLGAITRPMRALSVTVRKLTAGDRSARAAVSGAAEVREVAQAVNTQADEGDRLRGKEEESNRLRAMARAAGIQIREHLVADDVLRQAHRALADSIGADSVYLHLITDGKLGPPVGQDDDWLVPEPFLSVIPPEGIADMRALLKTQGSRLITEPPGVGGLLVSPEVREHLQRAGIASCLLTPFGVGTDLLGLIAAVRRRPSRPWSAAEIDAVESIAADLGRGLNHARMYEAENRLVNRLQELDQAKSDFFATVSHELRAPLTSIEGYVEMLGDEDAGPMNPEQRRMLETVDRSAVRLRNLIEDVFTLSKLESGAFATVMKPVNVVDVVAAAVAAVGPSITAGNLQLISELPDASLLVRADVGQLDRVFINLLSNAVKFTPEGGRIDVNGVVDDDSVVVRVSDTGIGIPESDQEKLFTRFFRASNATENAIPGTGLGLAIVRTIVLAHHGELQLESQVGKGTTVTVRLPLLGQGASAAEAGDTPKAADRVST